MPSSVHSQDQDQSMMDAAPQEQEQYQEEDDLLEMEEKRIVVVRHLDPRTGKTKSDC